MQRSLSIGHGIEPVPSLGLGPGDWVVRSCCLSMGQRGAVSPFLCRGWPETFRLPNAPRLPSLPSLALTWQTTTTQRGPQALTSRTEKEPEKVVGVSSSAVFVTLWKRQPKVLAGRSSTTCFNGPRRRALVWGQYSGISIDPDSQPRDRARCTRDRFFARTKPSRSTRRRRAARNLPQHREHPNRTPSTHAATGSRRSVTAGAGAGVCWWSGEALRPRFAIKVRNRQETLRNRRFSSCTAKSWKSQLVAAPPRNGYPIHAST
jgi:hypothetical protein